LVRIKVPVCNSSRGQSRAPAGTQDKWERVPQHPGPTPIYLTLLTSMFMHAGWAHLLGNLWFLFIFGSLVEKTLRSGLLFLLFYLVCGVGAGLTHVVVAPQAVIPYVGASGAISGVMGAYLWLHPLGKVRAWLGWLILIEVPALIALPIWL